MSRKEYEQVLMEPDPFRNDGGCPWNVWSLGTDNWYFISTKIINHISALFNARVKYDLKEQIMDDWNS